MSINYFVHELAGLCLNVLQTYSINTCQFAQYYLFLPVLFHNLVVCTRILLAYHVILEAYGHHYIYIHTHTHIM